MHSITTQLCERATTQIKLSERILCDFKFEGT